MNIFDFADGRDKHLIIFTIFRYKGSNDLLYHRAIEICFDHVGQKACKTLTSYTLREIIDYTFIDSGRSNFAQDEAQIVFNSLDAKDNQITFYFDMKGNFKYYEAGIQ